MAPQDATMYWLSKRTRNDLFLLYCFTDAGRPTDELRAAVAARSARIADLRVRLRELPADLDYPAWTPCDFASRQFVEHRLAERDWAHLQVRLAEVLGTGVNPAVHPWRLHVFRGIADVPGQGDGPGLVAVLQMSHALADGRRASAIARALFAESAPEPAATSDVGPALAALRGSPVGALVDSAWGLMRMPGQLASTAVRGYRAFQAQQQLAELTETGRLPAPAREFSPCSVNRSPAGRISTRHARVLVCPADRMRIPGRTVTVVVLTAISLALSRYLAHRGETVRSLGAQVPMALPQSSAGRDAPPRNSYRSLGVPLFADEPDLRLRADKIAAALAERRCRARHPLLSVQDSVTAALPAVLLRRDVDRYPLDALPDSLAGHTVVSSVDRGPADLVFGGGRVRFTAGFPAIGSVMRLTHGVHGLGDTVTLSLHADAGAVPDPDAYAALLRAALDEVAAAH